MTHDAVHISPEVELLSDILMAVPIGGTISYEDLSRALDYDIRDRRHILMRALRRMSKDGALFSAVFGVGYRRLPAEDAHLVGAQARKRIRRASRASIAKIEAAIASANDMSDAGRRRAYQETACLGLLAHLATDRHTKREPPPDRPMSVGESARAALAAFAGAA